MKRLLSVLLTVFMLISLFSACSSDKETSSGETTKNTEVSSSSKNEQSSQDAGEEKKEPSALGKIEVEEKDDGSKIAKSETGVEVELSGENFNKLYEEYESVAGTGSEKEEELLSQLQLMLESQELLAPAE